MFTSTAYAQTATGAAPSLADQFGLPLMIGLTFVVFYFLLLRPQQKRANEHKKMIAGVRRGDRVVTGGGIVGVVTKVFTDTEVQVEIADGVRVRVLKSTIAEITSRSGAPPAANSRAEGKDDDATEEEAAEPESREAKKR